MDTLERDYRCPFRWLEDGRDTRCTSTRRPGERWCGSTSVGATTTTTRGERSADERGAKAPAHAKGLRAARSGVLQEMPERRVPLLPLQAAPRRVRTGTREGGRMS